MTASRYAGVRVMPWGEVGVIGMDQQRHAAIVLLLPSVRGAEDCVERREDVGTCWLDVHG